MLAEDCGGLSVSVERYLAVPRDRAARLAGLTLRQVDYWAKTGLIEPSVDTATFGRRVRLYGFVDLLALTVAAKLKERDVSLQHIRAIVAHLKTRGYDRPFTDLQYATLGRRVYFQHTDGSWEGDARPD
jgi:DNA-binding transcriptional MerR regulator